MKILREKLPPYHDVLSFTHEDLDATLAPFDDPEKRGK